MQISNTHTIPQYPKIRGKILNLQYPVFVSDKLDGEANLYHQRKLISKASGKIRSDFFITTHLASLFNKDTILYGELYFGDGKANALYEFLKHQKDDMLKFGIFDIYTPFLSDKTLLERRSYLKATLPPNKQVHLIEDYECENKVELNKLVKRNFEQGYEGVVVKNKNSLLYINNRLIERQIGWVKIKHRNTEDVKITHIDNIQERMEVDFNGKTVGCKLHSKYKGLVKVGDTIEVNHFGRINGSLRNPVFVGKVI